MILDVTHQGEVIKRKVSVMHGNAPMVGAPYMPFESLDAAQVIHWKGRMLMTLYHGAAKSYGPQPLATYHTAG